MALQPRDIPIGLQLYSVRRECQKDEGKNFPNVVAAVAKMGYDGVEFAGYYGWQAADIRKVLDDNGLVCCGAHVQLATLLGDELDRSVEFHRTLGNRFLIVPSLPEEFRGSAAAWGKAADTLNEIGDRLRPHGMVTGYHNHSHEFAPIDGRVPWEIVFDATADGVVMQLDVGNAMRGGGDCAAYLRKYAGRATTLHVKEHGGAEEAAVGEGEANWSELLPLAAEVGGTEWYIVEHERNPETCVPDVGRCITNLRRIIGEINPT